eukprot:GABV01013209.1.p1 GENE.GABV01013209.1~~GABV01013209.1.p1  ORF type:complete len:130 (-),score=27.57 GABV01013209.1:11-361(-)
MACDVTGIPFLQRARRQFCVGPSVTAARLAQSIFSNVFVPGEDRGYSLMDPTQIRAVTASLRYTKLFQRLVCTDIPLRNKGLDIICSNLLSSNKSLTSIIIENISCGTDAIRDYLD